MFAKTLSVSVVAFSFLATSALAQTCVRSYTVQEGDICDSISAANNVSTYQLATINTGTIDSNCSNLEPNATICIGYEGGDCTTTYVVVADDTCDVVAEKTGVNTTMLWANNPQIDSGCDNIYTGEVLCTASTLIVPASPLSASSSISLPSTIVAASSSISLSTSVVTSSIITLSTPVAVTSTISLSTPAVVSSSISLSTSVAISSSVSFSTSAAAPASTSSDDDDDDSDDDDDDDDDSDLPYCDEL